MSGYWHVSRMLMRLGEPMGLKIRNESGLNWGRGMTASSESPVVSVIVPFVQHSRLHR